MKTESVFVAVKSSKNEFVQTIQNKNTVLLFVFFVLFRFSLISQNTRLWATYYGGTGEETYSSITTDISGNVYMAGNTDMASGNIASGGFQNTYGGGVADAFLVKFDAAGTRLWATYYGGTDYDFGLGVATDASGNVYLGGVTNSASGIASAGFQNTLSGGGDAFLVKFSLNGSRLWATYFGGTGSEYSYSVAADAAGNVYMDGWTSSASGIASGGFQNALSGGDDAFLVKFDTAGNRLWATYYGGANGDQGIGVATDISGNVYLAGITTSATGIASGGFQNTFMGGTWFGGGDAFLVKFDTAGNRLWATYYGGTGNENYFGSASVATDALGNVYLAGTTTSASGMTSGGFQNTYAGGASSAYLVKFDPSGTRLWATYYGGMGTIGSDDYGYSVAADAAGNVYLAGVTYSQFGIASGGFQNIGGGNFGHDHFLVKFDAACNRLCATYYGGPYDDHGLSVAPDASGNVYLSGWINSASGMASGGFQNTYGGGNHDAVLVKFTSCLALSATVAATNINCNGACTGAGTATPAGGTSPYTYSWNTTPVQTTQTATGLCAGTYSAMVTDAAGSTATATAIITQPTAISNSVAVTHISCNAQCSGSALISAGGGTPGYTYLWNSAPVQTTVTATGLCAANYTCTITDSDGCTATQTVIITEPAAISLTVTPTQTACNDNTGTANVNASGGIAGYSYSWSNGQTSQTATGLGAGTYTVIAADASGCTQIQTVTVTIITGPTTTATATPASIASGASTTLSATGGGMYQWSPATGLSCTTCANPTATVPPLWGAGQLIYCVTVTDANGCTDMTCVTVTIEPIDCSNAGELYLPNAFSPNGDGENDVLKIYYEHRPCIKIFKFVIYDRWGEKVFETKNPIAGWDGFYKGKIENTTVFVYYLEVTLISGEEITKKGNINLLR